MAVSKLKTATRQGDFILAMVHADTIIDAAQKAGIAPRTAQRWARDPAIQARLKDAQAKAFGRALSRLQVMAIDAAQFLYNTMGNPDAAYGVRVRAALGILEYSTGAHVIEQYGERIAQLEALVNEQERGLSRAS